MTDRPGPINSPDVCSHGRPDHQKLVRQVREAAGLFAGAMPISPREAFEQALDLIREHRERLEALEEIRQRVADGWQADRHVGMWYLPTGIEARYEDMRPEVASLLWPEDPDA